MIPFDSGVFKGETRKLATKRGTLIFLAGLLLVIISIHLEIQAFNNDQQLAREFQQNQISVFQSIRNYQEYSNTGVRLKFMLSTTSVFTSRPELTFELYATINSIILTDLYSERKGTRGAGGSGGWEFVLSWILFYGGTILVLYAGFDAARRKSDINLMAFTSSQRTVYYSMLYARIVVFTAATAFVYLVSVGFATLSGLSLSSHELTGIGGLLLSTLILMLFYFWAGVGFGHSGSRDYGLVGILFFWIIFTMFIPGIIDAIADGFQDEERSPHRLHGQKLRVMNDFETESAKKLNDVGQNEKAPSKQELVEHFWNEQSKEIKQMEQKFRQETAEEFELSDSLMLLTPVTFYQLTEFEVGSGGHQNYLAFYDYSVEKWHGFVRFWIDRNYYEDPVVLRSYIKEDENLFRGRSMLPHHFWRGVLIGLLNCLIAWYISHIRYRKRMTPPAANAGLFGEFEIHLHSGEVYSLGVPGTGFAALMLSALRRVPGCRALSNKIHLDHHPYDQTDPHPVLYIPAPSQISGSFTPLQLFDYFGRISGVEAHKIQEILSGYGENVRKPIRSLDALSQAGLMISVAELAAKKGTILVLDDVASGVSFRLLGDLRSRVYALKDRGVAVLSMVPEGKDWLMADSGKHIFFSDGQYRMSK